MVRLGSRRVTGTGPIDPQLAKQVSQRKAAWAQQRKVTRGLTEKREKWLTQGEVSQRRRGTTCFPYILFLRYFVMASTWMSVMTSRPSAERRKAQSVAFVMKRSSVSTAGQFE